MLMKSLATIPFTLNGDLAGYWICHSGGRDISDVTCLNVIIRA